MLQRWIKLALGGIMVAALLGIGASRVMAAIDAEINGTVNVIASETINHNITINSGGVLNIGAGVTLTFQESGGPFKILVKPGGTLILNGTASNRVVLTSDGETSLSGWQGIESTGNVVADYADINFASNGVYYNNNLTGSCSITHSAFYRCGIAVRVYQTSQNQIIPKFTVAFSNFTENGHAFMLQNAKAPETDCSQIYGNQFTSNTHNFYLGGDNNVTIRGNEFQGSDGNNFFEFGQTGQSPEVANNVHVSISNNNFYFIRSSANDDAYFVANVTNGTPIGFYNCYWKYNTQVCDTVAKINTAKLVTPSAYVAIFNPLSAPVNIGSDTTAPELVELSPEKSIIGTVHLTVVIRDDGWGVDQASVQIKVGDYPATVTSYTVNARQYIFEATVNIQDAGEYTWSVSARDLALPSNAMTNQNKNGQVLKITGTAIDEAVPPVSWETNTAGAYQLVTLPIQPYEQDHKTALGLQAPGSTVARWQSGKYVYYGDATLEPFAPGKGFWVKWGTGESFAANPISGVLKAAAFKTETLTSGWHLIGDPFQDGADMKFDHLTFHYGGKGHTFTEAVNDGRVGFGLWGYNGSSYQLERESLKAWQGYWLYVKQSCEIKYWPGHDPIPMPIQNSSFASSSTVALVSNVTWEARLTVSQFGAGDSANYFGIARSAASGVDNYDIMKPPGLQPGVQSYFLPQGAQQQYGADYRPDSGNQTWEFVVKGLQPGEARISWSSLPRIPAGARLLLKDGQTGQEIDLKSSNAYSFQSTGETERRFEIRMQNQLAQTLQISNSRLSRNPFSPRRENLVISYDLSANAVIELKIYDWVGNLVYVHPAFNETSGINRQIGWDGRNNLGRMAANGVYFCRLSARNSNAQTVQTLKVAVVN